MNYYKGLNAREEYDNEMMQIARKQTELLEQIAQLLQQSKGDNNEHDTTSGVPINNIGEGQQRQRRSYSKRNACNQ